MMARSETPASAAAVAGEDDIENCYNESMAAQTESPGSLEGGRRPLISGWGLLLTVVALTVTAVAVLWLSGVTIFERGGRTYCGRSLQELPNLLDTDLAGRCHLTRQARLRLGLQMAATMVLVGLALNGGRRLLSLAGRGSRDRDRGYAG